MRTRISFPQKSKGLGKTAIHLQCAAGEDTLSLLNLGASEVVGVDISEEMIQIAQNISNQLGANARWVRSDILELSEEMNGTADLVYTGRGAIIWIHDLNRWAQTVPRLLKPGGIFYMYEGHPVTYFLIPGQKSSALILSLKGIFLKKFI